ncbi:hypothetical protein MED121_04923 [Marinomonas sp. MED121]|uniref:DUF6435 family protein n=1 Tax=Marinomonas sp. MED121 TaxID=314277 RepID=UPI0000690192|nr:DUF6435 family protein [Marinomonas sp. MED121]EAQ64434.1 hypothetical protein MED121_04923 [Marinomonas sp. MED121]
MFSLFKRDPLKKLNQAYDHKLEQALFAQRKGDMRAFASLTNEAEMIKKEIEVLETSTQK